MTLPFIMGLVETQKSSALRVATPWVALIIKCVRSLGLQEAKASTSGSSMAI